MEIRFPIIILLIPHRLTAIMLKFVNSGARCLTKYHVDVALQGHDHAYLRTYPMKAGKPVESPADGTIYLVSVSGTKFYGQGDFDYKAFGLTNTSCYQVLDIQMGGDRLVYRAL